MPLMAATEKVGGYTWTYRINGNTAEIYNNGSCAISPSPIGAVTIPATLGGKTVTRIVEQIFLPRFRAAPSDARGGIPPPPRRPFRAKGTSFVLYFQPPSKKERTNDMGK